MKKKSTHTFWLTISCTALFLLTSILTGCSAEAASTHTSGKIQAKELPASESTSDTTSFEQVPGSPASADPSQIPANFMPAGGYYHNAESGEYTIIRVSRYDAQSFRFKITKFVDSNLPEPYSCQEETFCGEQLATFAHPDDTVAVYQNELYHITFDCSDYAHIRLSGLEEAVTAGDTFENTAPTKDVFFTSPKRRVPVAGIYSNGSDGDFTTITVTPLDEVSFKFKIEKGNEVILREHLATFAHPEDTTAIFQNENYTLTFDCSEYATITLSGFDEATTIGNTFWNSLALHAS